MYLIRTDGKVFPIPEMTFPSRKANDTNHVKETLLDCEMVVETKQHNVEPGLSSDLRPGGVWGGHSFRTDVALGEDEGFLNVTFTNPEKTQRFVLISTREENRLVSVLRNSSLW